MKLWHKGHCIFKGLTKKQTYFLFGKIYFTYLNQMLHYRKFVLKVTYI